MNITLTSEHKQFIDEKIKSGCYNSINEVIGDSLRLLDERDSIKSMQPDELRLELDLGGGESPKCGVNNGNSRRTTATDYC